MGSLAHEQRIREPIWQFLYRPMLAASLALHALVFLIPLPSSSEPTEAETEVEEEVVDLAALAAAQAQVVPPPSAVPSPSAAVSTPLPNPVSTPAAIAPPSIPQSVPTAIPAPAPTPIPQAAPSPSQATSSPTQAAPPTPVSPPTPSLGLNPEQIQALQAALRQRALSSAQTPTERSALAVPVTCPALGDYQADFCNGEQWKPGIFYQQTRSNENTTEALEAFQQIFADYNFAEGDPYADAPLYELKSKTDPSYPTFYLSLVQPSRIGRTTIGIVWAIDPNQPSEAQVGEVHLVP